MPHATNGQTPTQRARRLTTQETIGWLGFLIACIWIFAPGLFQRQIPAFRDAYHFYWPQMEWLDQQVQQGVYFPKWNPNEGLGCSVTGQPSSGLYYPLRPILHIQMLPLESRVSIFLLSHFIIAAWGVRTFAKFLGCNSSHAQLAGMCYALSMPVFFQVHNWIYLESAAWIGFTAHGFCSICLQPDDIPTPQSKVERFQFAQTFYPLGIICMATAGDFHTLANTLILLHTLFALLWMIAFWKYKSSLIIRFSKTAFTLVAAIIISAVCTQPVWRPAIEWSRASVRASEHSMDLTAPTLPRALQRVLRREPPSRRIYDFSVPPWHFATLVAPTLFGNFTPTNSRWISAWPAEGRMWQPSLYVGCLPCMGLILGLYDLTRRKKKPKLSGMPVESCLWFALFFATLCAFGAYGPIWLAREFCNATGLSQWADQLPADSSFTLYQLLTIIPLYDEFRYPAKWTPLLSLAIVLLGVIHLQKASSQVVEYLASLRIWFWVSACIGLLLISLAWVNWIPNFFCVWLEQARPDSWLGGISARSAMLWIGLALVHPVVFLLSASHLPRWKPPGFCKWLAATWID